MLDLSQIRRAFNRAAKTVDQSNVLMREVADRLSERLPLIRLQPNRILECGAQTGYLSRQLKAYYPNSDIIALDCADRMLVEIPENDFLKSAAQYSSLPFENNTFDMLISSFALNWVNDFGAVFREWRRVLKPNGLLLFTLLGVETLKELRESFIDCRDYLYRFPDMHDVGDLLIQSGFENPVMEMENIMIRYKKLATLFKDLKNSGTGNWHQKKPRGLFGKKRWQKAVAHYETLKLDNAYPASFEIIYGHAWLPEASKKTSAEEVFIPFDSIR